MLKCPFCGEAMDTQTGNCSVCSYRSTIEVAGGVEGVYLEHIPQNQLEATEPDVDIGIKIGVVVASIFATPVVGLGIGICFMFSKNSNYKKFGKKVVIILGIIIGVYTVVVASAYFFFLKLFFALLGLG